MRASETSVVTAAPRITYVVRVDRRTGKLVRTPVVAGNPTPKAAPSSNTAPPSPQISALVEQASKTHNVDPLLVNSVIQVESNYNQYAVSPAGAQGLMQLMPGTAKMLGVSNIFDAKENIEAGVRYLKSLQDQFKDDRLALAAYNAGPNAVEKYKWVPPYQETQNYVREVGRRYEEARQNQKPEPKKEVKPPAPEPPMAAVTEPLEGKHPKLEQYVDSDGKLFLRTSE
jgi:soluble lytic murein transglycosylase-like protein